MIPFFSAFVLVSESTLWRYFLGEPFPLDFVVADFILFLIFLTFRVIIIPRDFPMIVIISQD